jgi:RNA polymerase sigma-70 factor (ECF subfamily)
MGARAESESDAALLEAWRTGDRAAGERLMARHYEAVRRFFEVKAGFVADDLTQRTFLACVQQTSAVREASSFKAYLFGIARRQYFDHQRKSGRGDAALDRFGAVDELPTSLSRRVARRQEQQLVMQAMAMLPDDLLLALQLYYWEDMPTAEIGIVLEIPQSTVTSRLARARTQLHEHLARIARRPAMRDASLVELDAWARSIAALPVA